MPLSYEDLATRLPFAFFFGVSEMVSPEGHHVSYQSYTSPSKIRPTRRKRLLQLLGLVGVLEDKRVQVTLAADLEFGLLCGVLLNADRGCILSSANLDVGLDVGDFARHIGDCFGDMLDFGWSMSLVR